jgi:virginiamycin A acetyltransferase
MKDMLQSKAPNLLAGKDNCYFPGRFCLKGKARFGHYCAIGENLRIITFDHHLTLPAVQMHFYHKFFGGYPVGGKAGEVVVGSDVWIGDNVIILRDVNIGDGACIGAAAVVTKDVPPYAIVAGVPAKIIGHRFTQPMIDALLEIRWWDWSDERIARNKRFFSTDLSTIGTAEELMSLIE